MIKLENLLIENSDLKYENKMLKERLEQCKSFNSKLIGELREKYEKSIDFHQKYQKLIRDVMRLKSELDEIYEKYDLVDKG